MHKPRVRSFSGLQEEKKDVVNNKSESLKVGMYYAGRMKRVSTTSPYVEGFNEVKNRVPMSMSEEKRIKKKEWVEESPEEEE